MNPIDYHPSDEAREEGDELRAEDFQTELAAAQTLDLSTRGCRLRTSKQLQAKVELAFDLALGDVIHSGRGKIAWVKRADGGWEAGLEFTDLDSLTEDGIQLFLLDEGAPPATQD
ncbi:MAG: PilZ domain-containing protein [Planctomycetes bacterium]|nr:PilZ domain-containing protein [Planctomycetota bacterium]